MSNEQTEFAEFFRASWEPCLRAVVAVAGSPQLAEDQVAEAFAKAWVSWRKVRRHPAPRAWVVRTALNTGASWWRRRRPGTATGRPRSDGSSRRIQRRPRRPVACRAFAPAQARQREVIALRIFLDLDTDTIARQLGIEPGTVRMHLSRGIAALRQELTLTSTAEVDQ